LGHYRLDTGRRQTVRLVITHIFARIQPADAGGRIEPGMEQGEAPWSRAQSQVPVKFNEQAGEARGSDSFADHSLSPAIAGLLHFVNVPRVPVCFTGLRPAAHSSTLG